MSNATSKAKILEERETANKCTHEKSLGEWNAWVEKGKTKDEQLARYRQAPEYMRPQISSHMKTVIALGGYK